MKLLLKGGTVVSAAGSKIADLLIEDEKIVRVGQNLTDAEAKVVPMEGKLLFPGFIDAHTHFDLDVCNTTTADNFDTGTRSALREDGRVRRGGAAFGDDDDDCDEHHEDGDQGQQRFFRQFHQTTEKTFGLSSAPGLIRSFFFHLNPSV